MTSTVTKGLSDWLQFETLPKEGEYKTTFQVHHLGNVFIRSLHGGVTGATMEMAAEELARKHAPEDAELMIVSSAIDYLRITRDSDLHAKAVIVRISRRLCVIDVTCWQDDPSLAVARGVISIKITAET